MDVFVSFDQDREPVMSIEYLPIGPGLQRTRLTEKQRRFQRASREPSELRELVRIQETLRMEEL
jgi:hypothetical protein